MNISVIPQEASEKEMPLETISVIVPVTERYDDVGEMYREYKEALLQTGRPFEMIYVVEGNFQKAYLDLKSLKETGEKLTLIKHSRTFGEAIAINSGFQHASGEIILTLPAYHQVDASELPKLVQSLDDNDMVIVRRWPRADSWLNQLQTRLFQRVVHSMAGNVASDIGCGVRLFRREVLEEISLYGDQHRFLPILAHRQGFKVREVDIRQSPLERHIRTYPLGTYLRRLIDLLTVFFLVKFTRKPLRFFGLTGTVVLLLGFAITCYLVVLRLFFGMSLSDRPLFLAGILFVVLGLQIFAIGLVGEIIIFTHVKDIKEYKIEEILN